MEQVEFVAGVDEAGRGPLAGPVIAAAVVLNPAHPIVGLDDSKKLAARRREALFDVIVRDAACYGLGAASVEEIDSLNIYQATLLAMRRAVEALPRVPAHVLVDGNVCPPLACPATAIVQGDATVPAISAASILAKVTRDRLMDDLASRYPAYGFERHRGYPTPAHLAALRAYGVCAAHRRSFRPVAAHAVCREGDA
ncbi:MAG: ribonuclease HII [Bradyrhizobium sp.]|uniref:ribonuclease HII n=1 Tax=Bradyrhizobium sp. TaxID=376 RepID=UPI003D12E8EC